MREKMHYESGEAGRRGVREEGLAGWLGGWWVCSCQTKTSGGQVENIDYTEWSAGVRERRGPEHRRRDFRLIQCAVQSESDRSAEEVHWQSRAYLQQSRWLTDFTINSLRQYLTSSSLIYTRSPTFLLTPTHSISYTHIDKSAAQLTLL